MIAKRWADRSRMNQPAIDWQAALAQHDRWLRTVVLARVREPQAVDEVMQEVALAAVKQAAPLADRSEGAPWLYRLAVLQSLLYRRKAGPSATAAGAIHRCGRRADRGRPPPIDPLSWLMAEERRSLVRRGSDASGRKGRRDPAFEIHRRLELSPDRRHLGIGHAAVETRLHRARARLRQELAAMNVVEAA